MPSFGPACSARTSVSAFRLWRRIAVRLGFADHLDGFQPVQAGARGGRIRLQPDGFPQVRDGLVYPIVQFEKDGQIVMRLRVFRLNPKGFLEVRDRLLPAPGGGKGKSEIVVGLGEVRLQPERLFELGDGVIGVAGACEGKTEVVMRLGVDIPGI